MNISRRAFLTASSATAMAAGCSELLTTASSALAGPIPLAAPTKQLTRPVLIGTSIDTGMFKNFACSLKFFKSSPGYAYPAILDENGYPTSTPSSNIFGTVNFPSNLDSSTEMVLKWSGTATIQLARGAPGFSVVSGANFLKTGSEFNLTAAGTNARVVFRFAGRTPPQVTFNFLAGGKFVDLSNVVLCKLSDESAIDQATTPEQMFSDDYVAVYKALNAGTIRPMGWTCPNFGNVSQSRYLAPWRTSINISSQRWAPGAWAGTTTGINDYVCAAPRDATRSYVDGEMIQLQFVNPNTSGAVTINSGSRGIKPILWGTGGSTGKPLSSGQIASNSLATLTYDAVLDAFMFQQDGQTPCIPYELQVGFANRTNSNYWCNFSAYMNDESISAISKLVREKLNPSRTAYFEYGNEIWNFAFPATPWAVAKGAVLGFPNDNNRRCHGWYALRYRQVMGLVTTAWSPRATAQLRRVIAFQAFGPASSTSTYRFQGADLTGGVYPKYAALGYSNYNSAPNRPIDYCDVLSYATYYSGAQCANFDANYLNRGAGAIAGLLAAADDYASGVPSKMTSALAFIENDIRAGTLSGTGAKGGETLLALNSGASGVGIYPAWETQANTFGKSVECYEGGHESWYPSIQTCTSLGISTAYGGPTGKISALLDAFKATSNFDKMVTDQIKQFFSQPHSKGAAWLIVPGYNQWALSAGDSYAPKYKSWDAIARLNQ